MRHYMAGLAWLAAGPAVAATIAVTTTADQIAANGVCSLREAVTAANTDTAFGGCAAGNGDDVIALAAGEYRIDLAGAGEDANASGDFDIRSTLTVRGAGADVTRIRGDREDRVFDVRAGIPAVPVSARLEGLTIRNGDADIGGAVFVGPGVGLVVERCSIVNSAAGQGGGIGSLGMLAVMESAFHANAATNGGAIWSGGSGSSVLRNVTFDANTSTTSGSAASFEATAVLNNVTMTQNIADSDIDDIGDGAIAANATVTLSNSIVARNIDLSLGGSSQINPDCVVGAGGTLASEGHNLVGNIGSVCAFGNAGAGDQVGTPVLSINPRLQPFAVYGGTVETAPPLPNSPAVEAGSAASVGLPGACEATDARGVARPQGTRCDVGAAELDDLVFRDGFELPLP
ncbi:MAG: CSLREA domain-containing protein [Xanthomonadales bacterium]|nr:CSLREA domain-containing protein [Xanthomonadales bacterium]